MVNVFSREILVQNVLNKKIQNLLTKGIVGLEVNSSRNCKNFMKDILLLFGSS